jgi:uncharacterized protein YjbJ (UPF0337 family)
MARDDVTAGKIKQIKGKIQQAAGKVQEIFG